MIISICPLIKIIFPLYKENITNALGRHCTNKLQIFPQRAQCLPFTLPVIFDELERLVQLFIIIIIIFDKVIVSNYKSHPILRKICFPSVNN